MKKKESVESERQLTERLVKAVSMLSIERKKMLDELIKEWERLDYREDFRISCFLAVDYSTKDRLYQDFVNNLSRGGVFIETSAPFQMGQTVSLTISVPFLDKTLKVAGTIVRTERNGIGVQFVKKLTPYQKELIHNAITHK